MSHQLSSNDKLTQLAHANGLHTWDDLTDFIKNIPYGRIQNRADYGLVISERVGTCSAKHALLKQIADANNVPKVALILGMFRMNETNTPKIKNVLTENGLEYIPEAHCYLKINGKRVDFTANEADIEKIENDILHEIEITPVQTVKFKVDYHKQFLENWRIDHNLPLSFQRVWDIREQCIKNLSHQ